MSKICLYNSLRGSLMHATGHATAVDWDSTSKFSLYGWRCTTNENDYSMKTLMGNNEEQYDIQRIVQPKPLVPREPCWFPSQHPELEPPLFNPTAQSCYTIDCRPPYGSIFFACVQHSEKEQEGCRKSNTDGENLQMMPSEKQEACLLAVLQGYPSSKKTCHTLKPNVASRIGIKNVENRSGHN
ncbi:LOW QUALITY PROTEIN: cilia- and flagella-associated protein 68 [Ciconia maguari]